MVGWVSVACVGVGVGEFWCGMGGGAGVDRGRGPAPASAGGVAGSGHLQVVCGRGLSPTAISQGDVGKAGQSGAGGPQLPLADLLTAYLPAFTHGAPLSLTAGMEMS